MSLSTPSRRDRTADAVRGFAATLVIAGHLIIRDSTGLPAPYWFGKVLDFIHMPLFFFFGGYFSLSALHRSCPELLRQKAHRLLVPYVMWSSVAAAAKVAAGLLQGTFAFASALTLWIQTLLFAQSMWFFVSLFTVHVIGWVFVRALDRWHGWAFILPLLLALLPGSEVFAWHKTQEMLPFFVLGILMARERIPCRLDAVTPRMQILLCLSSLAVLAASPAYILVLAACRERQGPSLLVCCAGELLLSIAALVLLSCLFSVCRPLARFFSWLGRYSMQLYCLHMFFVKYFAVTLPAALLTLPQAVSSVCYFVAALGVGITCAVLSWAVLDRIPLYRLLMLGQGSDALTR